MHGDRVVSFEDGGRLGYILGEEVVFGSLERSDSWEWPMDVVRWLRLSLRYHLLLFWTIKALFLSHIIWYLIATSVIFWLLKLARLINIGKDGDSIPCLAGLGEGRTRLRRALQLATSSLLIFLHRTSLVSIRLLAIVDHREGNSIFGSHAT